ncbi:hypothetical protein [Rhizobium sp. AB2/73]|uniref:hypothetical protein n=1 Tax=Rhizobium TaxID=379 RepID=UPI0013B047E4|nr:hypothetical protein [Rhizobium sp. AB2/73]QYA15963.1 hypothetical protein J5284_28650 [Rhizobium sp. AB2/73]UEQ84506.1 hypothetical protein I8E17_29980 [Rhizobium sp. AB2/73]
MTAPIKHIDTDTRDGIASLPEKVDLESELPYGRPLKPADVGDDPPPASPNVSAPGSMASG